MLGSKGARGADLTPKHPDVNPRISRNKSRVWRHRTQWILHPCPRTRDHQTPRRTTCPCLDSWFLYWLLLCPFFGHVALSGSPTPRLPLYLRMRTLWSQESNCQTASHLFYKASQWTHSWVHLFPIRLKIKVHSPQPFKLGVRVFSAWEDRNTQTISVTLNYLVWIFTQSLELRAKTITQ